MQFKVSASGRANCESADFDELLKQTWTRAENDGVLKFRFADTVQKRQLDGKYSLQCYLNVNRLTMKRKPQEMNSVRLTSVKKDEFNFTKISEKEKLFDFIVEARRPAEKSIHGTVIVNNAPIEFCSSLLVLELEQCLPQSFTQESLLLALYVCASSNSKYLRLGFNSPGAASSVNHSHWHLYYQEADLAIAKQPIVNNQLTDWFLRSLVFELDTSCSNGSLEAPDELLDYSNDKQEARLNGSNDREEYQQEYKQEHRLDYSNIAAKLEQLINYISVDLKLAYNLFVTRCATAPNRIRLFVWPRLPQFGAKEDSKINPALCEFSGFFICKQQELFDSVTEHELTTLCKEFEVDERLFNEILHVKNKLFDS